MKSSRLLAFFCSSAGLLAQSASLIIPSASGPLVIDGIPEDAAWRSVPVLSLTSSEFGAPFPAGGETRIATRGNYVCLSARLPEPDRPGSSFTGRNPNWWSEDLVTWTFRVQLTSPRRNFNVSLAVNPLGAWRLQNAATGEVLERTDKLLVAAHRGVREWTVEAAIPLDRLAKSGLLGMERIRAPRPVAPELHWYWPAANERTSFQLAELTNEPTPEFRTPQPRTDAGSNPANRPVADLAWVPSNAWSAEQRDKLRSSRTLETSLLGRMSAIAEQEKFAWQKVDSRESWERFRDPRLAALRKSLEPFPERTPLRPVVTHRANYGDGFVIENVVFESRPGLLVTANLYLPDNSSGRIPAIIVVHSHHAPKTQSELQDLGMTWARAGTAVLVMDQLCAGERSQSQPWYRESYFGRYALGNQLLLTGESLMQWMVWDLMRGVDLLLERPYIDPERVIMLGAVAGGGDPAAVTAALDPRIAAVIPFNFGEAGPEEHYTLGPRGYGFDTAWPGWGEWETTRCMPRSVVDQFFPWMICASVAPRPFLYSFEIGWPQSVEQEPAWARYKKVFELYGARDRLDEVHGFGPFPGPGECTNVGAFLRKGIYPVLKRWLNVPVPAAEYHNTRPDSELMCLTAKIAAERNPKPASAIALELARNRLAASRSRFSSYTAEERRRRLRSALQEKLGDIEPLADPSVQRLWEKASGSIAVEALSLQTEPGIILPVLMLKPAAPSAQRVPVVLAITQGGKGRFLSERAEELVSLLKKGIAICLPDLRGTGELAETQSRGPDSMALAATEFMLGKTMLGGRLKDTRTVLRYLGSRPDIDAARLAVWGESFAETNSENFEFDQSYLQAPGPFAQHQAEPMGALIALLTGLYEDRVAAVAAGGGLVSFLSVLEDRFCHVPQDVIVPGILEVADIPDIVAAQVSSAVLMEGSVDGRNRLAGNARSQAREPRLAWWLASRLAPREP